MERIDYLEDRIGQILRGRPVRDLDEAQAGVRDQITRLRTVLGDAKLQIEYLHEKFQETGSGNAILTRIADALAI